MMRITYNTLKDLQFMATVLNDNSSSSYAAAERKKVLIEYTKSVVADLNDINDISTIILQPRYREDDEFFKVEEIRIVHFLTSWEIRYNYHYKASAKYCSAHGLVSPNVRGTCSLYSIEKVLHDA